MIYHISQTDDDDTYFRDVVLTMALEDYSGETWMASWEFDKDNGELNGPVWQMSPASDIVYEPVATADVPRWCRTIADRMEPQIIAEHFQALIDEWRAAEQAELEECREEDRKRAEANALLAV